MSHLSFLCQFLKEYSPYTLGVFAELDLYVQPMSFTLFSLVARAPAPSHRRAVVTACSLEAARIDHGGSSKEGADLTASTHKPRSLRAP